jgi:hypothetical protein
MPGHEIDVHRILTEHGCTFVRHGKGIHDVWLSPISQRRFVVDGKIKSRHTANAIMKQQVSSTGSGAYEALGRCLDATLRSCKDGGQSTHGSTAHVRQSQSSNRSA